MAAMAPEVGPLHFCPSIVRPAFSAISFTDRILTGICLGVLGWLCHFRFMFDSSIFLYRLICCHQCRGPKVKKKKKKKMCGCTACVSRCFCEPVVAVCVLETCTNSPDRSASCTSVHLGPTWPKQQQQQQQQQPNPQATKIS